MTAHRPHEGRSRHGHHHRHERHAPVLRPPAPDDDAEVAERQNQIAAAISHWRGALAGTATMETPINPLAKEARISSEYGERHQPRPGASPLHLGVDFVPADGTRESDVVAALSGEVLFAGEWNHRMGNAVFVGGDDGNIYVYGHLSPEELGVLTVGQRVSQGQVIGAMGHSGNTTGPDLHFEIRRPPFAIPGAPRTIGELLADLPMEGTLTQASATMGFIPSASITAADRSVIDNYFHDQPLLNGHHLLPGTTLPPGTALGLESLTPEMANLVVDAPGGQHALIDPELTRRLAEVRLSEAGSHPHRHGHDLDHGLRQVAAHGRSHHSRRQV